MSNKVKCVDCGFLAMRDPATNQAREVTEKERNDGLTTNPQRRLPHLEPILLLCFQSCELFVANHKVKRSNGGFPKGDANPNINAINTEIECDSFRKWERGKSPEKHEEMSIVEQVEAKHAAERAEDLKRQDEFEARIERRFQENEAATESRHGRQIGFSFLNVLLAAAMAAFSH